MGARTVTEKATRRVLISRVDKLRWCFWHARLEKAKDRMQGILLLCRVIVPETPGVVESMAQLDYRTRELVEYVEANGGSTINYGARHRRGAPISTATAESAVNQRFSISACASVNKCAGLRSGLICLLRSDVLSSTVTLFKEFRDTSHQGSHCRAKLPSSWSSSDWHRSNYNPKVFNAPLDVFPGLPEFRNGFVYANDKPGLSIDLEESEVAKYPCKSDTTLWTQTRLMAGELQTP